MRKYMLISQNIKNTRKRNTHIFSSHKKAYKSMEKSFMRILSKANLYWKRSIDGTFIVHEPCKNEPASDVYIKQDTAYIANKCVNDELKTRWKIIPVNA